MQNSLNVASTQKRLFHRTLLEQHRSAKTYLKAKEIRDFFSRDVKDNPLSRPRFERESYNESETIVKYITPSAFVAGIFSAYAQEKF